MLMKKLMIYSISVLSVIALLALGGCGSSGTSPAAQSAAVQQQATTVATTTVTSTVVSTTTIMPLIYGTVSTGVPMSLGATITVEDATGNQTLGYVADQMGTYSVNVQGMTAPFMLQCNNIFSFATQSGMVTNINPITSVAIFAATGLDPATVFATVANISTNFATLQANIGLAVTNIQGYMLPLYPTGYNLQTNFLNGTVLALTSSYDQLLDYIHVLLVPASDSTAAYYAFTQIGQTTPFLTIKYASGAPVYTPNSNQVNLLMAGVAGIFTPVTIANIADNMALPT